jgi:hypothetical protein
VHEPEEQQPLEDGHLRHTEAMVRMHRQMQARKRNGYSFSMTAAITQDRLVGFQVVEGGSDSVLFENFLYRVLMQLRKDQRTRRRRIVVYLDNARTHKSPMLTRLAQKTGVTFLYSPQYSPWMMSVEQFHNVLKRHVKELDPKPRK